MTSCPEAMGWEFGDFEKYASWNLTLGRATRARGLRPWSSADPYRDLGGYGMRSTFVGSDSTVSSVRIVSFSPRKAKVKKFINVSFWTTESRQCFADFAASVYLYSYMMAIQHYQVLLLPEQIALGSNGNEKVLQSSKAGESPLAWFVS